RPLTGPYAPFRMGIQSYSLRAFSFEKMVELLFELELKYVELYPAHLPLDLGEFELGSRRRILRHNSVDPYSYGVVPFTKDHEKNREVFELGKKLGLLSISADPAPDSFDSLDKLVEEYKLPVAIHNHGPEDKRYRTPEMIDKAIKDHHKLIGLCVDTGHFLRVDVNPVEVVKQFKDRVYGVHLKEVKNEGGKKQFKVLGEGDLDTAGLLRELKGNNFQGNLSLEYEEEERAPVPSIKKCLAVVREAVKKLA
ncbi:MAG: sugar phosphate isomerase/epimerase family protein, partial [Thermoanaerobaculia bacterium]